MVIPLFDCCLFTQKTAGSMKGEIQEGIRVHLHAQPACPHEQPESMEIPHG